MKINTYVNNAWIMTCKRCEYQWEVNTKKETKNVECPRCGDNRFSIIKVDPELVKKRGRVIGLVEYDPIKDKHGAVYSVDKDGTIHRRK